MKLVTLSALTLLIGIHTVSVAQNAAAPMYAKVSQGGSMLKDIDINNLKAGDSPMNDCQPLKGDTVQILQINSVFNGMGKSARVRVLNGACQGNIGLMGVQNLESAPAPANQ